MYTRAFFASFSLIAAALFITYWFDIRLKVEDGPSFHKLMQESIEQRARHALQEQPAIQKRTLVQKDIWFQDDSNHFCIKSERSELTLQKKEKLEAIEKLEKIQGTFQGGYTLSADLGVYTFPSHQFIAEDNCHITHQDGEIQGSKLHVDFETKRVVYEKPKVNLKEPQIHLESDTATLALDQLKPHLLMMDGNVHLISSWIEGKESYAIADHLIYNPIAKTLLFTARKKVLFWQEGLHLSAEEVLIRQDQTVEGRGNVHFTFDLEEQHSLEQVFKRYL